MRLGCVGIGSNAIRLLTAQWADGRLCGIKRERRGTRLFAGLVEGRLTEESMNASAAAVGELSELARREGAAEVYVFATSAVRDAVNGEDFKRRCEAQAGVPVEIISGQQEAVLSYLGACEGGRCGVIDIGGGSTEFTFGEGDDILGAVSLQMGAVRMTRQLPIFSEADYEKTVAHCCGIIEEGAGSLLDASPRDTWVGVGGTMTMLGAMQKHIPLFVPETCEGMGISREDVAGWGRRLSAMTLDERLEVVGLMPRRIDIMPAGIAILEAAMRSFGVETLHLSAQGNMDGFLKKKFQKRY